MSSGSPAFQAVSVTKRYRRLWSRTVVQALEDVSFEVQRGTVFGLLGPNGAGKTTLVKLALTIAHADSGEIRIFGQQVGHRAVLSKVGYLPESPRFPAHLTAIQVLRLYGSLSGASTETIERNARKWCERLELSRWLDTRVAKFSKGMNERLALAQALVHDPEFIFLDEPTDGLDPLGRMEVRHICRELAESGKTIFINSHILAEIEMICDRVALMKGGRIIEIGSVAEVTAGGGGYELRVPVAEGLDIWLSEQKFVYASVNGCYTIQLPDRYAANNLIAALRDKNMEIESLTRGKRTLESVFIERVS